MRLLVEGPGAASRVIPVLAGLPVRLGRDAGVEIQLDDTRASRCHAAIEFDGAGATVTDLGSSNGTYLGARRIDDTARLRSGDVVRIGSTRIAVVITPADVAPRARTSGSVSKASEDAVIVDPASVAVFARARKVAGSTLAVLITGETGTGKEVIARTIHRYSPRANGPFLALNCAALPDSIAESELFGAERGAFTGAVARKIGMFEAACGGTLLLDEVGELSLSSQARLLRVAEEGRVTRLGGTESIPIDVRLVAATNRDLEADVAQGRFRGDLYYRLSGVVLHNPPLRDRPRDVVPLAERMIAELGSDARLRDDAASLLRAHRWPGNVRELRNAIECAIALGASDEIRPEHLPATLRFGSAPSTGDDEPASLQTRVDDVELRTIVAALEAHHGNQSRAARTLGISRRALIYKMERLGLKPPPAAREP